MDPAAADDLLAGLDDAQREAVTNLTVPMCVLAGAGSGKTRVLTRRIAWRCATGVDEPRRLLALTFTRAAAIELSARLRALGLREGVRSGTFHAVAWAELRARAAEAGRPSPALLEKPARLLNRVADLDRRAGAEVAGELSWARARCVALEDYPVEARRAGRSPRVGVERIVELGADYEHAKRRRGLVDFDDLLAHLTTALDADPEFAATQRWRFAHLYVDEFQDLNPLQHRLLEGWRGGRPALTVVGDPNQAIYGWNGSDPTFIERFAVLYPGSAVIAIDHNYRSSAPIVTAANALLDTGGLAGVRLHAVRGEGPPPEVLGYADDHDEVRALARAVLDAKVPGTSWGHQAVLARTNALLEPAEAALTAVGVPVRVRGRLPFHEEAVIRAALRAMREPGVVFGEAVAAVAAQLPEETPADDTDTDTDGDGLDTEQTLLARLVELADRYRSEHRSPDAHGFRAWLINEADNGGDGDGVDLVTFHGAKGREWPVVHLLGIEEGYVPIAQATTAEAEIEERRLFYVACTRAERRLRISWSARRRFGDPEGEGASRRPSPYLIDLAPVVEQLREEATPARPATVPRIPRVGSGSDRGDALRRWRATRARAAGVAPGAVMPDVLLDQLLRDRPVDVDALGAVPGARSLVMAGWAEEVLAVLSEG